MDKENLKNPFVWIVTVIVLLGVWTLYSTASMMGQRTKSQKRWKTCREVLRQVDEIRLHQRRAGTDVTDVVRTFQGESSARECAEAAEIPVTTRLQQGESVQKKLKTGEYQYTETYKLHAVRLLQIAQFLDHAETNFASVDCVLVDLTPASATAVNSWDVTIRLRYTGL
jgi:hypothetical protein